MDDTQSEIVEVVETDTILLIATPDGIVQMSPEESAELIAQQEQLAAQYAMTEYQFQRAAEYPPITDYLDGIVKGDTAQVQAYIDACLAVKEKYPKPQQL